MKLTLDHNVIIDLASGHINIARLREILAKSGQRNQRVFTHSGPEAVAQVCR